MSKNGRFVRNSKGFRALLISTEIRNVVDLAAQRSAERANNAMGPKGPTDIYGYRATTRASPRDRAAAYVRTGGWMSRRDNLKNNTLLKSIGR